MTKLVPARAGPRSTSALALALPVFAIAACSNVLGLEQATAEDPPPSAAGGKPGDPPPSSTAGKPGDPPPSAAGGQGGSGDADNAPPPASGGAPDPPGSSCGDGVLDESELCDDGNHALGDGCNTGCEPEAGWTCSTPPGAATRCRDVNECGDPTSCTGPDATCTNTPGGFSCGCRRNGVLKAGVCVHRSCDGLRGDECSGDDCCATPSVIGATFPLGGATSKTRASVTSFELDKYEVTVGRFRRFVKGYAGAPADGAGAHPGVAGSGWQASAWSKWLPANATLLRTAIACDAVYQNWDETGAHDALPMNCVSWYEAFAFCAWDGGRLPSEAEWEYAAAGGGEARLYPWGITPQPSAENVVFNCFNQGLTNGRCTAKGFPEVGSKPLGLGKYRHLDLLGSVWEWNLDYFGDYPSTCNDCARVTDGSLRIIRGRGFRDSAEQLTSTNRGYVDPTMRAIDIGFRCAASL